MHKVYKPGELAPENGSYIKVDGDGNEIDNAFDMRKGEKFPPTQSSDVNYKMR